MSSPVRTSYIFADERPTDQRQGAVVHTIERGTVREAAPILWQANLGKPVPAFPSDGSSVPVTVSGSAGNGTVLAADHEGWMVTAETPDATLLVMGTGELPTALTLESVDTEALKRSELRNSGLSAD